MTLYLMHKTALWQTLFVSMFVWNSFKNNALNNSEFYDHSKSIDSSELQDYLLYSLAGILLFEYIVLAFRFSPSIANTKLLTSFYAGFMIFFLSVVLSKFSLHKGWWAPIKYWKTEEKNKL